MDFMPPSKNTMEGTISASFSKSLVVALADLMDDGSIHGRKADEKAEQTTECSQSENPESKTISKSSYSYYCSPYDYYSWMGGDCMRETAATSLATITECATMKTDNTTEMVTATAAPTKCDPAIVSPCKSNNSADNSTKTSTDSSRHELDMMLNEDQNFNSNKKINDSISSCEMNSNANADIISQYHQQYLSTEVEPFEHRSVSKNIFPEFIDYSDPLNSLLVEDQTDASKNARNVKSDKSEKDGKKGKDWHSSNSSASSWCGGVPAMLMYNYDDDQKQEQLKQEEETPDYYAEFKPQRQYAFDEEDGEEYGENSATIPALVDSDTCPYYTSTDDGTTANETGSVITSVSSVQSFMVINRPHANTTIPTMLLNERPQQESQRITQEHGRHLHNLIASTGRINMASPNSSQISDTESDQSSDNNRFDHALTPSLMRKLQKHFPYGKRGDSFWLQYSLIRDGASLDRLLEMVKKDAHNVSSVLAIETVEGEVFGAFLTQTWKRSHNQWYGGRQSFLWSTSPGTSPSTDSNNSNAGQSGSNKDKKKNKNDLWVFPYSFVFANSYVQLCDRDRLLVGGGDGGNNYDRHCYGFGLALERDLLRGSSCPCTTFESPSLSKLHSDGSSFEIRNLEVWTLTPCLSMIENPSQGLTRVHKRGDRSKPKKDQSTKVTPGAVENTHALQDMYNCSQCRIDNTDDGVDRKPKPKTRRISKMGETSDEYKITEIKDEMKWNKKPNEELEDLMDSVADSAKSRECEGVVFNQSTPTPLDLAASSFPGAHQTLIRNRNVRRHNRQRRKNRDEYIGLSVTM